MLEPPPDTSHNIMCVSNHSKVQRYFFRPFRWKRKMNKEYKTNAESHIDMNELSHKPYREEKITARWDAEHRTIVNSSNQNWDRQKTVKSMNEWTPKTMTTSTRGKKTQIEREMLITFFLTASHTHKHTHVQRHCCRLCDSHYYCCGCCCCHCYDSIFDSF